MVITNTVCGQVALYLKFMKFDKALEFSDENVRLPNPTTIAAKLTATSNVETENCGFGIIV